MRGGDEETGAAGRGIWELWPPNRWGCRGGETGGGVLHGEGFRPPLTVVMPPQSLLMIVVVGTTLVHHQDAGS